MARVDGSWPLQVHNQARRFIRQPSAKPLITYGKKDTKLIPLTANQFRGSVYDLPPNEQPEAADNLQGSAAQTAQAETSSEDSELSDAEPILRRVDNAAPAVLSHRQRTTLRAAEASRTRPESQAIVLPTNASKPQERKEPRPAGPKQTKAVASTCKTTSVRKLTAQRRLPVNELFLVSSPVDYGQNEEAPTTSSPSFDVQDPITDHTSSPCKRSVSPRTAGNDPSAKRTAKTPLTAIRTRLKAPPSIFKALPKGQKPQRDEPRGRDGFDASELKVLPRPPRKQRRPRTSLTPVFSALHLSNGPLPDVEFQDSGTELKMEKKEDDPQSEQDNVAATTNDAGFAVQPHDSTLGPRRQVSFSDPVKAKERKIVAELSTVSAPIRIPSESEGSEDSGEEDFEDENDGNSTMAGYEEVHIQHNNQERAHVSYNEGVSLDFRQRAPSGFVSRPASARFRGHRALIEVDEAIEIPEPTPQHVDSMAITEPREICSEERSSMQHGATKPPHRPRSILKKSTPMIPDSTTRPEETVANTRRNSNVDISESRYFTEASEALRVPDPARHIIVPRRRSSYFEHEGVEILDSEAAIPETSLEPAGYVMETNLNIPRKHDGAVWTSSCVPREESYLKALTSSVSREHGTISQSVRRRPSLGFRSPTKIR